MTVKEQYKRERKRIQSFISKAEKKGYKFEYELPPSVSKLDKVTKKMVNELKKITPKKLRKNAIYGGELAYGEFIPAEEGFKLERSASAKKASETRKRKKRESEVQQDLYVIDEIKTMIDRLPDIKWYGFDKPRNYETVKSSLISLLDDTADQTDLEGTLKEYLQHLLDNLPVISVACDAIQFDSEEAHVDNAFNRMIEVIIKRPLTIQEAKNIENFNEFYDGNEFNHEN